MKSLIWPTLVVGGVLWLTTSSVRSIATVQEQNSQLGDLLPQTKTSNVVQRVNAELMTFQSEAGIQPAGPAAEMLIWRRLSLALHGTIPSLEEIRDFQADAAPDRLGRWLEQMLNDDRFADYFAERLARSYVGVENGQFLIFRRDRFISWLTTELRSNRPYDEIVRAMIAGTGVWTGEGEVNFLTAAFADDEFDPNKLTARTVRAFLGQRMDCAQCHDHPFDHWKQSEFEGIAAHFGQVQLSLAGVVDSKKKELKIQDSTTLKMREVSPSVPFHPEWMGGAGTRRERLARWITHPENQRFERAVVNRVWGLMFGKPFLVDRPVDDIPDPELDSYSNVLNLLGADFREHGYDLWHLIRNIAATDAFKMSSSVQSASNAAESFGNAGQLDLANQTWAVFPLVRLRPEQVIGSMLQANNVRTIDQNSHLFVRALRFFRERDFVDEFGDPGVDELQDWSGTISQALLRMNGEFSRELTSMNPFSAPSRVAATATTAQKKIETIYLSCLTRLPTPDELDYFLNRFSADDAHEEVEDLYWVLFNSPEFSWNH